MMRLTVVSPAPVFTNAPSISDWSGAAPVSDVPSVGESLTALPQPPNVGAGSAAPAGPASATVAASTAATSMTMYLMAASTWRGRTTCVFHPQADQPAEVRE